MPSDPASAPLDDFRALLGALPGPDLAARDAVRARDATLTKPQGSLGRLEWIAEWLAAWQGRPRPHVGRPLVAVFATNHGVAAHGVSAFPQAVTQQMLQNFSAGGAAINQLCLAFDLGLKVYDLGIDQPSGDITEAPAMSEAECAATIAFGMEATAGGFDLLCLGEMGIGNTTVAAALYHALYGGRPEDWIGPGSGVGEAGLKRKAAAVAAAAACHAGHLDNPLEALWRVGGREIAAMAGAIIAARVGRIPVIVDGYVATAAAAVLHRLRPDAIAHCLFAHVAAETAHGAVLERLGQQPLLDLGMRLGEGTGAAIAAALVRAAALTHTGMATFSEAGVSPRIP